MASDTGQANDAKPPTMDDVAAVFGANLRRFRKAAGLSQEALSLDAEIDKNSISHLEIGRSLPRLPTLMKLRATLGVSIDDLVEGIEWKPGSYLVGEFVSEACDEES